VLVILKPNTFSEASTPIKDLTSLTKLPGISISTSYLEKRVIYYDDYSNKLYPNMKNYSQMDFVYAK